MDNKCACGCNFPDKWGEKGTNDSVPSGEPLVPRRQSLPSPGAGAGLALECACRVAAIRLHLLQHDGSLYAREHLAEAWIDLRAALATPCEHAGLRGNQRQWDLLRQMRHELHTTQLITNEEYAQLAVDHAAVARLEDYDCLRLKLTEAETRARQAEWTRDLAQAASSRDALEKQRLRAELAALRRVAQAASSRDALEKQRLRAELAALRRVAQAVGDYDWGTSTSEAYHFERVDKMAKLRALLAEAPRG